MSKRLMRDENNKLVAGVCSGLGNYFNVDPVLVRLAFILAVLLFGFGILPYILLWIIMPKR
jgi:phage shock protein PspC (stress-responsive transcriptional regulator)